MPANPPDFGSKQYWSTRFTSEQSFEWLLPTSELIPIILNQVEQLQHRHKPLKIHHIGCGTSTLGLDLHSTLMTRGYQDFQVVDSDYVTSSLPPRRHNSPVKLVQMDLLDPETCFSFAERQSEETEDGGEWALIIDKSTSDAISCTPATNGQEAMTILCENLSNVVRRGGRWICLSYSSTRFDLLDEGGKEGIEWEVVEKSFLPAPSENESGGGGAGSGGRETDGRVVYTPDVGNWLYILERK